MIPTGNPMQFMICFLKAEGFILCDYNALTGCVGKEQRYEVSERGMRY